MLDLLSSVYSTFCPADIQSLAGLYQDTNVVCIICRNIIKCAFSFELYKSKNLFFFSAKIDKYFFGGGGEENLAPVRWPRWGVLRPG